MGKGPVVIENNGLDEPPEPEDNRVRDESVEKALLAEREAYAKRGLTDRAKAVDLELERLGYRGEKKSEMDKAEKEAGGGVTSNTRSAPGAETATSKDRK